VNGDDRDLYERFASLKSAEASRAPAFSRVMARDARRSAGSGAAAMVISAAATVAVVASLGWFAYERSQAERADRALAGWQSLSVESWDAPTAFLLALPASDVLDTVPELGTAPTTESGDDGAATRSAPSADSSRRSSS
jgi:hypothetical protein